MNIRNLINYNLKIKKINLYFKESFIQKIKVFDLNIENCTKFFSGLSFLFKLNILFYNLMKKCNYILVEQRESFQKIYRTWYKSVVSIEIYQVKLSLKF